MSAKKALTVEKYHEHFVLCYDPELAAYHIRLVMGNSRDLFPLNKKTGVTGCSAFTSNLCGASNSPENLYFHAFVAAGEHVPAKSFFLLPP